MSRQQSVAQSATGQKKVQQMIALLDELHDVITAENRMLSSGLPASLSQTVLRKTELANGLDNCLAEMRAGELTKDGTDPAELAELIGKLQSLRSLMGENSLRIKQSMDATRRRIDAIMRALRDEPKQAGIYGADALRRRRIAEASSNRLA
jgi:flagellar biosynthesis/type III secretory pathway chaperone